MTSADPREHPPEPAERKRAVCAALLGVVLGSALVVLARARRPEHRD